MTTLAELYADFAQKIEATGATPDFMEVSKKTFYCGALAAVTLIISISELSEDERNARLDALEKEFTVHLEGL